MGRRETVAGFKLESAHSLAADFNSAVFTVKTMDNVGINIEAEDVTDNTGTFQVQHRIKKDDNTGNKSGWATLTLSADPTLNNAADVFLVTLNQIPPGEIRIVFTAAGITPDGTVDIWVSATSVGG